MARAMILAAVLCVVAHAADNATVAPQATASLRPQAPSLEAEAMAITIPQMLSYQGRLTDTLGQPVADTTYSVQFRLYTIPSGGSPFWNETQIVRTRGGLFSTLLGSVTPIGSMPDAGAAYLGMSVSGGAELLPRLRIVSAAYAYKADTANYALASAGGGGDNAWVRGTPDSVLYTVHMLGIARGGADNTLYGADRFTHVNLGVACTTGANGQSRRYIAVGGGRANTASESYATVGGGFGSGASGNSSTVSGGYGNDATSIDATVGGGSRNTASGNSSTVGGGSQNTASGEQAAVGGGQSNSASGLSAVVAGGVYNSVSGTNGAVCGGLYDTVRADWGGVLSGYRNLAGHNSSDTCATVAGGWLNRARDAFSFVGGGRENVIDGPYSVIAGGDSNGIYGGHSVIAGGKDNGTEANYATVGGGLSHYVSERGGTVAGGEENSASGRAATVGGGIYNRAFSGFATVAGGDSNSARYGASVGGGEHNVAEGYWSTVAGGCADTSYALYGAALSGYNNLGGDASADTGAVVAGGRGNRVLAKDATIGGGRDNTAVAAGASVGGGSDNYAAGNYAAISGGGGNYASGWYSAIPGGYADTCAGHYAMVMGNKVRATSTADFTLAYGEDFTTSTARAVVFYHSGAATKLGVGVQNPAYNIEVQGGAYCNGTNWVNGSSRKLKTDITTLTPEQMDAVLEELDRTDVVNYRYKSEASGERHIGLIAEDAPELLATPERDGINTADAIGFLFAALKAQQAEIEGLKAELKRR